MTALTLAVPYRSKRLAMTTERRRGERFEQSRPVAVYEPYASRFFGGETVDVSTSGMKLRLPGWVKLGEGRIIDLHAGTEAGGLPLANRRRAMLCRVVWTRSEGGEVLAGVEFLQSISAEAA
jgi:hypothetical protein